MQSSTAQPAEPATTQKTAEQPAATARRPSPVDIFGVGGAVFFFVILLLWVLFDFVETRRQIAIMRQKAEERRARNIAMSATLLTQLAEQERDRLARVRIATLAQKESATLPELKPDDPATNRRRIFKLY